jgi:MraZ protein
VGKNVILCIQMSNLIHLIGSHEVSLDAKGRFLLPKTYKDQLPEDDKVEFVITRGFEKCLKLYPKRVWMELSSVFAKYSPINKDVDRLRRAFNAYADMLTIDGAGRLNISKSLQDLVGLKKNIKLISLGDVIEIWDVEAFTEFETKEEDLGDLSNKITGGDYLNPFNNSK